MAWRIGLLAGYRLTTSVLALIAAVAAHRMADRRLRVQHVLIEGAHLLRY